MVVVVPLRAGTVDAATKVPFGEIWTVSGFPCVAHQIGVPPVMAIASASHPEVLEGDMTSTVPVPDREISTGMAAPNAKVLVRVPDGSEYTLTFVFGEATPAAASTVPSEDMDSPEVGKSRVPSMVSV